MNLLTSKEVSQMLGVSIRTLANYKKMEKLPYYQFGRIVRYDLEDVLEHIESHTQNRKGGMRYE